jgi:Integral membrane protein TerC family
MSELTGPGVSTCERHKKIAEHEIHAIVLSCAPARRQMLSGTPSAWLALVTLIVMEVVLGVDNLVFIALLSSRLPSQQGAKARRIGIGPSA